MMYVESASRFGSDCSSYSNQGNGKQKTAVCAFCCSSLIVLLESPSPACFKRYLTRKESGVSFFMSLSLVNTCIDSTMAPYNDATIIGPFALCHGIKPKLSSSLQKDSVNHTSGIGMTNRAWLRNNRRVYVVHRPGHFSLANW